MTVHPVRMNGTVLGVPQTLSYFEKMQERIVNFVTDNSNITRETFMKLMMQTGELVMDVGTVLDGQAAVDCGLIDELGNLSQAVDYLYAMIDEEEKAKQEQDEAEQQEDGNAVHMSLIHICTMPSLPATTGRVLNGCRLRSIPAMPTSV